MSEPTDAAALSSWLEEKQSAWLYRELAAIERRPALATLFGTLAAEADSQADLWAAKIANGTLPEFAPTLRARIVAGLARRFGVKPIRQVLAAMKVRGMSAYAAMHPGGHSMPMTVEQVGESQHRRVGGGNLRAAVFGANDGLISNASLIMGFAGATANDHFVLLSGATGLLAGALSMAAGEFISVRSQRELYEHQIRLERDELDEYPEEEAEELALIYAARGMNLDEARSVAQTMISNPRHALDVLAREELGLNPDDLGSAWGAAGFSFCCFAVGALVPLLPFLLGVGGIVASGMLASVAIFGLGAAISLFTGRRAWFGGVRMLSIGLAAAGTTYGLGYLFGVGIA